MKHEEIVPKSNYNRDMYIIVHYFYIMTYKKIKERTALDGTGKARPSSLFADFM